MDLDKKSLTYFEILSEARAIFISNFPIILVVAALCYIPNSLISYFMPLDANIIQDIVSGGISDMQDYTQLLVYVNLKSLLNLLFSIPATLCLAYLAKESRSKKPVDIKTALVATFSCVTTALISSIIVILIIGVVFSAAFYSAFIIYVIAPICLFIYIRLYFHIFAIILNKKNIISSLQYSNYIVKNNLIRALCFLIVMFSAKIIVVYAVSYVFFILDLGGYMDMLATTTALTLSSLYDIATTLFYLELEKKKLQGERKTLS